MYDRTLGSAMNYGNIGPKQKKNPYTRWQDQESALNDGFEMEGNAPSVVPKVKDTLDRAILRNPQRDSALSNLYQQSAATQPQQTTPIAQTGYQSRYFTPTGNMRQDISSAYQNILGREPDQAGLEAHLGNPQGLRGVLDTIYGSQEYQNLPSQQGQSYGNDDLLNGQPTNSTTPGIGGGTPPPDPLAAAVQGQRTGWGFTSPTGGSGEFQYTPMNMGDTSQFEGFNFDNRSERDLNSAKYIFAQFASQIDVTQPDAIQRLVALMNEHGVPARQVGPDSIDMGLGEGPMDVIRGGNPEGGIPNIAWQWIPGAGSPGGMANQLQQKTLGALSPLQGAITGGDNNVLAQILTMLQGQLGGQGTK